MIKPEKKKNDTTGTAETSIELSKCSLDLSSKSREIENSGLNNENIDRIRFSYGEYMTNL